jgi:putative thioredoxin
MSEIVVNVNEADFEFQVVAYSQNVPVVVEFWALWCKPCKELGPMLERIALQAGGAFRLARLDVDDNPNLALYYNVRSIPVVKVFSSGGVVAEFSGVMPEFRVREFIARITPPSPSQLALERADGLLSIRKLEAAEKQYRQLLDLGQEIPPSLLGLAKTLLWKGEVSETRDILTHFPASREYQDAQILLPLIQAITDLEDEALPTVTELDAAFSQSLRLAWQTGSSVGWPAGYFAQGPQVCRRPGAQGGAGDSGTDGGERPANPGLPPGTGNGVVLKVSLLI